MPFEGTTPVKKKKKAKKVKSSGSEVEHTPAQTELLALMAKLCACEQVCRQRYRAISGYTRERTTSESVSFGDLMQELSGLEQTVAAALGGLDETEVAGLAPAIATLLDAGSADFFSGSRRAQGRVVMSAARKALCRKSGGDEDDEEEGRAAATLRLLRCVCVCEWVGAEGVLQPE